MTSRSVDRSGAGPAEPDDQAELPRLRRRSLAAGIGRNPVRKVAAHDGEALYQALSRQRHLSPRTIRQVHAVLRAAFAQAVRSGWIRTNPVASASPPSIHKADVH